MSEYRRLPHARSEPGPSGPELIRAPGRTREDRQVGHATLDPGVDQHVVAVTARVQYQHGQAQRATLGAEAQVSAGQPERCRQIFAGHHPAGCLQAVYLHQVPARLAGPVCRYEPVMVFTGKREHSRCVYRGRQFADIKHARHFAVMHGITRSRPPLQPARDGHRPICAFAW
jgi:hypothetical protein